LNICSIELHY